MMEHRDRLDRDKITEQLGTRFLGRKVVVFGSTESTNNIAAEYGRNPGNHGLVVFAEQQTRGRGRNGHVWASGKSDSLLFSVVLTMGQFSLEVLSLGVSVAAAEAIGKAGKAHATIKWPNDIMLGGRKVAGILVESRQFESHRALILGVGINCHQEPWDFEGPLLGKATSMDIETGTLVDRVTLAKRLLVSLEKWLERVEKKPEKVVSRWKELSDQYSRRVSVVFDGKKYSGNCVGLDPERGLVLQLDRGGVRMFNAAQTSIAK